MLFILSSFQQQFVTIPKFSVSFPAPANESILNALLTKGDLNSKLVVFSSRHVSSTAFKNSSRELQYIYGPHPTTIPSGNELERLVGSLYDHSNLLPGPGKVNGSALSFACAIIHSNLHMNQEFVWGTHLPPEHIRGTS